MKLEDNLLGIEKICDISRCTPVAIDLITSICGKYISSGVYRDVFEYNLDPNYVVKIEPSNSGCNLIEYMIWDEVKDLSGDLEWVKKWFAPCGWISPNGRIMTMKKTKNIDSRERPNKIPEFLWDIKWDNFGWIGKNYVCHDYGQFYNMIHYPKRMRKAQWF